MNKTKKERKDVIAIRVLQVEHGSFSPLILSPNGGMGRECRKFYSHD